LSNSAKALKSRLKELENHRRYQQIIRQQTTVRQERMGSQTPDGIDK